MAGGTHAHTLSAPDMGPVWWHGLWSNSRVTVLSASVVSARHQQVKSLERALDERTCRRRRSDGRARIRAAWAVAWRREGRLERPVQTVGKKAIGVNLSSRL